MWICLAGAGLELLLVGILVIDAAREAGWWALPAIVMVAVGWAWFVWLLGEMRELARLER
jgi:hypothetical protein